MRRLAFIRYLYNIAIEQSRQPEPMASASILTFHDSVELFLQLVCEQQKINSSNIVSFMQFWEEINKKSSLTLTQKEPMRRLNDTRGQLKHKGIISSKFEIESARINVTNFFQENTSLVFGSEFDNISMVNFIQYMPARDNLNEASKLIEQENFEEAQNRIAVAFAQIVDDYENRKRSKYGQSPFFFGDSLSFLASSHLEVQGKNIEKFVDTVKESIESMRDAMKVLTLGLDYRRYTRFRLLTPKMMKTYNEYFPIYSAREKSLTIEDCRYCYEFVIESAILIQDFDFDIEK
jgi:hypothetical protein